MRERAALPVDALEEIERLGRSLLPTASVLLIDRRLSSGRGQQHYAAWIYGVCLAAREALRLDPLADRYLLSRTFDRIFGTRARFLRTALERQDDAFAAGIASGRAAYAAWDGHAPLRYPGPVLPAMRAA